MSSGQSQVSEQEGEKNAQRRDWRLDFADDALLIPQGTGEGFRNWGRLEKRTG